MQLRGQSEPDEDEMGSVALVRQGAKVVAGSQDGVLSIFSWGYFNDCSDRFPGEYPVCTRTSPSFMAHCPAFAESEMLNHGIDKSHHVPGLQLEHKPSAHAVCLPTPAVLPEHQLNSKPGPQARQENSMSLT